MNCVSPNTDHTFYIQALQDEGIHYAVLNGSIPQPQRQVNLSKFRNDPMCRVLLMSSVGTIGMNVANASVIIMAVSAFCFPSSSTVSNSTNCPLHRTCSGPPRTRTRQ